MVSNHAYNPGLGGPEVLGLGLGLELELAESPSNSHLPFAVSAPSLIRLDRYLGLSLFVCVALFLLLLIGALCFFASSCVVDMYSCVVVIDFNVFFFFFFFLTVVPLDSFFCLLCRFSRA